MRWLRRGKEEELEIEVPTKVVPQVRTVVAVHAASSLRSPPLCTNRHRRRALYGKFSEHAVFSPHQGGRDGGEEALPEVRNHVEGARDHNREEDASDGGAKSRRHADGAGRCKGGLNRCR